MTMGGRSVSTDDQPTKTSEGMQEMRLFSNRTDAAQNGRRR
jgi:hypothetical protein